ncbi:restriction endonuclease subunit S [Piscibacillus halophilus]|uniref:restriction endonuclease subunit S n=1 Tax=Piscibacillus halophilus TaxID=571933 RepID=UPI002409B7A5|nr:restriction endonuclease subunit S [Piscibacillus halophilus]
MSEWVTIQLKELLTLKRGYDLPHSETKSGPYPVVASTNVRGYHNEHKVDGPVITVGRSGSIGHVQYIESKAWPLNTTLYMTDAKGNNKRFIYYFLKTIGLEQFNSGAGVPTLNRNHINLLKVKIPKKTIQTKIADVLSTYDRLIENNNRRIQILEQTTEELYKEWFVRMRFHGYEKTKFDRGIPEGWEVQKLSDLIRVTDGTHDTPKEVTDGVPLVTGRNIVNGQIDFNTTYNISKEDHKKINVRSSIEKHDILYSNIGTIGQMTIVNSDNKYSVKNLIILKTSQYDCYEYIYLHFKNEACQRHFDSIASGASQKFISLTEMRNYKILIPKKETLEQFRIYVSNLFNQIVLLSNQNQNLIKQRDLLLPRLMNGTITVK